VSSFTEDPQGPQWDDWKNDFGIEQKTTDITLDLDKYEELRRAMEKVMLEKVQYKVFWLRSYFLNSFRQGRRKKVLKGESHAVSV